MIPEQTTYKPLFIAVNRRLGDGGINPMDRQAPPELEAEWNQRGRTRQGFRDIQGISGAFQDLAPCTRAQSPQPRWQGAGGGTPRRSVA